jgi:Uma2 family endonuclease
MSNLMTTTLPVPATARLTAEEFLKQYEGQRFELIDGVATEIPMPFPRHGQICMFIGALLWNFARQNQLGHVISKDSFIRTGPESVRGPDVMFISFQRIPAGPLPAGFLTAVPELVIEVRSPSDRMTDLMLKVTEYQSAGIEVVMIVDPNTESVALFRQEELPQRFSNGDTLSIPEILPGFSVSVREFFL